MYYNLKTYNMKAYDVLVTTDEQLAINIVLSNSIKNAKESAYLHQLVNDENEEEVIESFTILN